MDDYSNQGDTGVARPLALTLLIARCAAAAAVLTAVIWFVVGYALDWMVH